MSLSKLDRARNGPGLGEVLFGAVLSILLGAVLCAAWLVLKPVTTVGELPKVPVPGMVYFVPGDSSSAQGGTWLRKRQAFLEGQSIELSEQELNTAIMTPTERPKNNDSKSAMGSAEISAGVVNFRITKGVLQVALPVKIGVLGRTVIVQASGAFVRKGGRFVFSPSRVYVGSCSVELLPVVRSLLLRRVYAAQSVPEELVAAWDKLSDVSVSGSNLNLTTAQ